VFTLFIRARLNELDVFPLPNQESYRLDAFAKANALIVVPPGESLIEQGSRIQVIELNAVWK
jgi:molybdopterin biosynthesis enzyme